MAAIRFIISNILIYSLSIFFSIEFFHINVYINNDYINCILLLSSFYSIILINGKFNNFSTQQFITFLLLSSLVFCASIFVLRKSGYLFGYALFILYFVSSYIILFLAKHFLKLKIKISFQPFLITIFLYFFNLIVITCQKWIDLSDFFYFKEYSYVIPWQIFHSYIIVRAMNEKFQIKFKFER